MKIGVVAISTVMLGAMLASPVPAQASPSVTITRDVKNFADCAKAGAWLNSVAKAGEAHWRFTTKYGPQKVRDTGGSVWEDTTTATATYDPAKSSITITELNWPKMTNAGKAAVRYFEAALLAHENGHLQLAKTFLARYYSKYPLLGAGTDAASAVSDLKRIVALFDPAVKEALQRQEDAYDAKTHNGRKQSAVGGKDVVLTCH